MKGPVTLGQERMWLQDRLSPGDSSTNMFLVRRLRGDLDPDAFARAVSDVAARHDPLRTVFGCDESGTVWQRVLPPAPVPVERVDLRSGDPDTVEQRAHGAVSARTNAPFDLANGPLLRVSLLRLGERDHVAVIVMHHIVSDGWSLTVLASELAQRYRGALLESLPLRYPQWAAGQRAAGITEAAKAYWREQLAGLGDLHLPADQPPGQAGHAGAFHTHRLPPDLTEAIERLARSSRCSLFMTLLAAYQALLSRYTGQRDIAVGTFTAGRDRVQTEPLIGYFLDTLVMRGDVDGDLGFADLLARTRSTALQAFAHPQIPFEELLGEVTSERDPSRHTLFRTTFILQNPDTAEFALDGLHAEAFDDGFTNAKMDLAVEAWRDQGGLTLHFGYRTGLFTAGLIARMAVHLESLLRQAVGDPTLPLRDLDLLGPAERERLDAWSRGPAAEPGEETVADLIADRVRLMPRASALRQGDRSITYAEMDRQVRVMAGRLREAGAAPGDVIGICLPPSIDLVVAMLACWRAGAAYLPLDPVYPDARLHYLLSDSGALVVVAPADLGPRLPAGLVRLDPAAPARAPAPAPAVVGGQQAGVAARPGDTAYLIYTSGSTGQPKGVRVSHRALAVRVRWMAEHYALTCGDTVLQFASPSFDTHAEEIFPCLVAGARLLLRDEPGALLPELLSTSAGQEVTVLDLPTAYWHELVTVPVAWPPRLRLMILGADQVDATSLARWYAANGDRIRLINTYGPTEATIVATSRDLTPADADRIVPIGGPLAGVRAYVLDGDLRQVPPGVAGELYLGGAGLADGYHGRAGHTGARFVPDAFGDPGTRMYGTGDLVRLDTDGVLTFLGRTDDQVKVRGFRIETGEVQAHLLAHPGVGQAVVVAREVAEGDRQLVAYVAGSADTPVLRAHLADSLPPHMIPTRFVRLERLPLTPHGKVDRRALPDPARQQPREQEFMAPRTAAEELVAQVWRDVLSLDRVGVHDDFFAIGGHSLLATRVAARLAAVVEVQVPLRALFTHRTLADLAAAVEGLILADLDRLTDDEALALLGGHP